MEQGVNKHDILAVNDLLESFLLKLKVRPQHTLKVAKFLLEYGLQPYHPTLEDKIHNERELINAIKPNGETAMIARLYVFDSLLFQYDAGTIHDDNKEWIILKYAQTLDTAGKIQQKYRHGFLKKAIAVLENSSWGVSEQSIQAYSLLSELYFKKSKMIKLPGDAYDILKIARDYRQTSMDYNNDEPFLDYIPMAKIHIHMARAASRFFKKTPEKARFHIDEFVKYYDLAMERQQENYSLLDNESICNEFKTLGNAAFTLMNTVHGIASTMYGDASQYLTRKLHYVKSSLPAIETRNLVDHFNDTELLKIPEYKQKFEELKRLSSK